jgi:NADPH:quinone reductase-like Zn-dependent oxidoreductase
MRAVTIVDGKIKVREHPDPQPGTGQILVRVRAAGLNSADLLQQMGGYPPPPGVPKDIPGLELAGEVVGRGPASTRFAVGDRVMAVVGGGGQAELAVVHEREATPVPSTLSWPQAGGAPEVFTTAHDALFTQAELGMGERVCVHGAAGGVGTAAVQLASAAGARVTATVRDPSLRQGVQDLADGVQVIAPDEAVDRGPYDVILELVGAPNMPANIRSLAVGGRITVIGVGAGAEATVNLHLLMLGRARIHASTLRARPLEGKALAARAVEAHVLPLFETGRITVPVAASFPLEEAAAAYERFASGGKFGKIVLLTPG